MKIKLTILLLILCFPAQSQIIDKFLFVSFIPEISRNMGSSEKIVNNAHFPKFFPNIQTCIGANLTGIYLFSRNAGVGLSAGANYMTGWKYGDLEYYEDASSLIISSSPVLCYKTPPVLRKKLSIMIYAGPVFSNTIVNLSEQEFFIENLTGKPLKQITTSSIHSIGYSLSGALHFSLNSKTAISVNCSYRQIKTGSVLYSDKDIRTLSLGLGVTMLYLKDKTYYF